MKQTRKALKIEVRKELAKEYRHKYESRIEQLINSLKSLRSENRLLRDENDELTAKVHKFEDWNNRLLEFCDIPEDERKEVIEHLKTIQKENQQANKILQLFHPYLRILIP